jgi:hypothetical protein
MIERSMQRPFGTLVRRPLLVVLAALAPSVAGAQGIPSRPITLAGGRVTLGGDVTVAVSSNDDDPAWFNYTGYEHNALRLLRLGAAADVRLAPQVSILAQLVSENRDGPRIHALYVRVRPWTNRAFDLQVGRIPPTFGAFARRSYATGTDNPVIGYPLAYQYLTSLRADAVPATADDLLANRAEGWRPSFPIGSRVAATGVPLVTAFEWDTGIQGRMAWRTIEFSAALTTGTLSEPRVRDNNGGKQIAGRLAWRPGPGLVAGVSGARGEYIADAVTSLLPMATSRSAFVQRAWGLDLEYSRGHFLARGEGVVSEWRLPVIGTPPLHGTLQAWSISAEGRYAFWPGAFAAGRYDYLGFNRIRGTATTLAWDAPVARVEVGGGYYVQRNVVGKLTYQHNWREAGVRRLGIWSAQVQYWF